MSREATPENGSLTRFPRVSGDEPALASGLRERSMFSPRERG